MQHGMQFAFEIANMRAAQVRETGIFGGKRLYQRVGIMLAISAMKPFLSNTKRVKQC